MPGRSCDIGVEAEAPGNSRVDSGSFYSRSQHIIGSHDLTMVANPALSWTQLGRPGIRGMPKNEEDAGYSWSQAKGKEILFLKTQRVRSNL